MEVEQCLLPSQLKINSNLSFRLAKILLMSFRYHISILLMAFVIDYMEIIVLFIANNLHHLIMIAFKIIQEHVMLEHR